MILTKVKEAREFFNIKDYPSNFFDYLLEDNKFIKEYGILLFKQEIGKLSGFIGYAESEIPIICINYARPLGHQNFTLAHEIGHWFLHKGLSINDTDREINGGNRESKEKEAHKFAAEFLYPIQYARLDAIHIEHNNLLKDGKEIELGNYVNQLCHKYCTSFSFTLKRLLYVLYYPDINKKANKISKKVSPLKNRYGSYMYDQTSGYQCYRPYIPMDLMKAYVEELIKIKKIGLETGQAIIERNMELEVSQWDI